MEYQKGFILPLLLIIIAILFVSGGAYVYTQKQEMSQSPIESTISPQPTSTTQTTSSQTSDWKTYENQKLGFEIRYPAQYSISTQSFSGSFVEKGLLLKLIILDPKRDSRPIDEPNPYRVFPVLLYVWSQIDPYSSPIHTIEEYTKEGEIISINGERASLRHYTKESGNSESAYDSYYFIHNDLVYYMAVDPDVPFTAEIAKSIVFK